MGCSISRILPENPEFWIYHDAENCPIRENDNIDAAKLFSLVKEQVLRCHRGISPESPLDPGDLETVKVRWYMFLASPTSNNKEFRNTVAMEDLRDKGVQVVDTGSKRDSVDTHIQHELTLFGDEPRVPTPNKKVFVLIAGDRDYSKALQRLQGKGLKPILIANKATKRSLMSNAKCCDYKWEEILSRAPRSGQPRSSFEFILPIDAPINSYLHAVKRDRLKAILAGVHKSLSCDHRKTEGKYELRVFLRPGSAASAIISHPQEDEARNKCNEYLSNIITEKDVLDDVKIEFDDFLFQHPIIGPISARTKIAVFSYFKGASNANIPGTPRTPQKSNKVSAHIVYDKTSTGEDELNEMRDALKSLAQGKSPVGGRGAKSPAPGRKDKSPVKGREVKSPAQGRATAEGICSLKIPENEDWVTYSRAFVSRTVEQCFGVSISVPERKPGGSEPLEIDFPWTENGKKAREWLRETIGKIKQEQVTYELSSSERNPYEQCFRRFRSDLLKSIYGYDVEASSGDDSEEGEDEKSVTLKLDIEFLKTAPKDPKRQAVITIKGLKQGEVNKAVEKARSLFRSIAIKEFKLNEVHDGDAAKKCALELKKKKLIPYVSWEEGCLTLGGTKKEIDIAKREFVNVLAGL
mmetsp:Transcript_24501/g.62045  ORF Transcript_24501/g.62045 Transcript_24501/m.62045 type:complete len:637 (-) Transcript_24501:314-2224(-)